jgi:beta-glucosidase-like glycosyl hydrolase
MGVRVSAECLHGGVDFVEGSQGHTIFPQPIGLAAAFDTELLGRIATAIGDELRAKNNMYTKAGNGSRYECPPMLEMMYGMNVPWCECTPMLEMMHGMNVHQCWRWFTV